MISGPGHSRRSEFRLFAALVMMTPSAFAMAAETEPNDTIATATPAPLHPFFDGFISGVAIGDGEHAALDVDLYYIEVPPEWTLPIGFSVRVFADDSVDLMLRWFNADGVELANNDEGGNPLAPMVPSIYTVLFTPGTYYFGVSSTANPRYQPAKGGSGRAGAGGEYVISYGIYGVPPVSSSLEPNDTNLQASHMGSGSFTVSSEWIGDGEHGHLDVDIYRVSLVVASRLDITVSGDSVFDPVLRVRSCADPLPTPTTMDWCTMGSADDEPDGGRVARLSTAMYRPGDVYIMVSGSGNRGFDPMVAGSGEPGSVGPYELAVTVSPLLPRIADEPNDSLSTATLTPVLIEGRPDSFTIDALLGDGPYATLRGDRDFYELRTIDAATLSIKVEAASLGSSLVPVLVAYDDEGGVIAHIDSSLSGGDALLTWPAACATLGTPSLKIMVMGTEQRLPADPFDPLVTDADEQAATVVTDGPGSTGPYRLFVSTLDSQTQCAVEPNDTIATATPTGLVNQGTYICRDAFWGDSQCPDPQEDVDIWRFTVTQTPVVVRVESWYCGMSDPIDLTLFDQVAQEIAFVIGYDAIRDGGTSITLTAEITSPGDYFVVAGSHEPVLEVTTPCSCHCWSAEAPYDIAITLSPYRARTVQAGLTPTGSFDERSLFATRLDPDAPRIDVYDSDTGTVIGHLPAPEPQLGGLGGVASNGTHLFYLGSGRFPLLYLLDQTTGELLHQYFMWVGSGYYTGAAALGNNLYLLDHRRRQVHVVNPYNRTHIQSLSLGAMHGISIGGGLTRLHAPNRLYVADAFNTGSIYEIYPENGALTETLQSGTNRPTALAAIDTELFVADFRSTTVEVRNRDGVGVDWFAIEASIGVAGSAPLPPAFGDMSADGGIDLADAMLFQLCFGNDGLQIPFCSLAGDFNNDGSIQLDDAAAFFESLSGP